MKGSYLPVYGISFGLQADMLARTDSTVIPFSAAARVSASMKAPVSHALVLMECLHMHTKKAGKLIFKQSVMSAT